MITDVSLSFKVSTPALQQEILLYNIRFLCYLENQKNLLRKAVWKSRGIDLLMHEELKHTLVLEVSVSVMIQDDSQVEMYSISEKYLIIIHGDV